MADTVGLGRDARVYEELGTVDDVKRLLDSSHVQEKLQGIKSVMAMAALGRDIGLFFADVVKNVSVPNLELKKLIYMYLVRHAGDQPDLALLSVNSFQRDLSDQNPLIRALALRVMSSIRLPIIQPIVLMAVQKCAKDGSAHVRKTVATALPKLMLPQTSAAAGEPADEEASHVREEVLAVLQQLLGDMSPATLTAAVFAFTELCPQRLDLLHSHYHRMVRPPSSGPPTRADTHTLAPPDWRRGVGRAALSLSLFPAPAGRRCERCLTSTSGANLCCSTCCCATAGTTSPTRTAPRRAAPAARRRWRRWRRRAR